MSYQRFDKPRSEAGRRVSAAAAAAYVLSALLLLFYLAVLYLSLHPRVSDDYRMRYLEEGYFWEAHGEE